jgi:hypothetical protein
MPFFNVKKNTVTRRLHNTEMKKLVCLLRGMSCSQSTQLDTYHKNVKEKIKNLPRRMQQSPQSNSSNLCDIHKGLDCHLVNDIWCWIHHEFDSGVGRFIYPVIMSGTLTAEQELKTRQLEPVVRMWHENFKSETSAPPGREPFQCDSKWAYQPDQCPACMLARIGSDEDVLLALYAGMIGRFHVRKLATSKIVLAELDVAMLDNPKSKRVRFVRYWIKASRKGETLLLEAVELGIKLKRLHKEWKETRCIQRPSIYGKRYSLDGTAACNSVTEDPFRVSMQESERLHAAADTRHTAAVKRTATDLLSNCMEKPARLPYIYNDCSGHSQITNSKVGPRRRPSGIHSHTPLEQLGFDISGSLVQGSIESYHPRESDADTVYPEDSISVAPLRISKIARPNSHGPTILNYPPQRNRNDPVSNIPSQSTGHSKLSQVLISCSQYSPPHVSSLRTLHIPNSCEPTSTSCTSIHSHAISSAPSTAPSLTSRTSLASNTTIASYDRDSACVSNAFLPYATSQERLQTYRSLLAPRGSDGMPIPQMQSMYYGYDDEEKDPFEDVDEEVLDTEELYEVHVAGKGRRESTDTRWGRCIRM